MQVTEEAGPRNAVDDRELLEAVKRGDQAAFRQLYRRHARAVYAFARTQVEAAADADEVMQDTFLVAWKQFRGAGIEGTSALPWLLAVCRRTASSTERGNRRRNYHVMDRPIEEERIPDPRPNPEEEAFQHDLMRIVEEAVAALPELDRTLYKLCIQGDLSYADAADQLGVSHGTVRNRLSRLRKDLRRHIDGKGGGR